MRRLRSGLLPVLALVMAAVLPAEPASAVAGDLDPSFKGDGKVSTLIGSGLGAEIEDMAIAPDSKIVVAGWALDQYRSRFALARYMPDGSIDPSFGDGGRVMTSFGNYDQAAYAVLIQPDGKIVAAGYAYIFTGRRWTLARYNPDGSLDTSFGDGGRVLIPSSAVEGDVYSLALQPDGKIVAAGEDTSGYWAAWAVARLLPDGSLDPSFGDGGIARDTRWCGAICIATDVAVQPDGKIVTGGWKYPCAFSCRPLPVLVRFNPDGTLDEGFGDAGQALQPTPGYINGIALQPDGKIVAAGTTNGRGPQARKRLTVSRFLTDGGLDPSFGDGGLARFRTTRGTQVNAVALDQAGRIVAAGAPSVPSDCSFQNGGIVCSTDGFLVFRLTSRGRLDTSFGTSGLETTTFGPAPGRGADVALDPGGRILVAGSSHDETRFALARYLG